MSSLSVLQLSKMNSTTFKKTNILGKTLPEMEELLVNLGQKPYRAKQILKWIHQRGISNFYDMTDLSKELRSVMKDNFVIEAPNISYEELSEDGTKKWILDVGNQDSIEMVLIPEGKRATLCVSSQVGCAINCSFCATGKQGFSRNLDVSEIIGQIWLAANSYGVPRTGNDKNITNVVMMGMGEPLHNFDPVVSAMNIMLDENAYGLSKRKVTLSTSGLVPEINKLSKVSDVSLTISLHAPNDELRNTLVPVNKKYPIQLLLDAVKDYVEGCDDRRITTIEYILIDKVNDTLELAKELADLLTQIKCKINLIPFNEFDESDYLQPSGNRIRKFKDYLVKRGYVTTIRSTRGDDIMAACGQLVGQVNDKTRRKERIQRAKIEAQSI